ncbi:hypothetical protein KHA80_15570 [Anaerobacillus sp. HL2]|nr:hypothetical protein KHA80_15570 [Anaerobacillus sp. HL2]
MRQPYVLEVPYLLFFKKFNIDRGGFVVSIVKIDDVNKTFFSQEGATNCPQKYLTLY